MASLVELLGLGREEAEDEAAVSGEADDFVVGKISKGIDITTGKRVLPQTPFDDVIEEAATKHGVPYEVLYNILKVESNFNPRARNPKSSARGIAQIIDSTAKELGVKNRYNPHESIDAAARYLRKNYDMFQNWDMSIAAYNQGPSKVKQYGGIPEEAVDYVRKVTGRDARMSGLQRPIESPLSQVQSAPLTKLLGLEDDEKEGVSSGVTKPQPTPPPQPQQKGIFQRVVEKVFPEPGVEIPKEPLPAHKQLVPKAMQAPAGLSGEQAKAQLSMLYGAKTANPLVVDEAGVPLDYTSPKDVAATPFGEAIAKTLEIPYTFARRPDALVHGMADFFMSIPGFLTGLASAISVGAAKLIDQIAYSKAEIFPTISQMHTPMEDAEKKPETRIAINFDELYNAMAGRMEASAKFFDPAKHMLIGPGTEESHKVAEIAMAPLLAINKAAHSLAENFESPNAKGLIKIIGDVVALGVMKRLLHGEARIAEFDKDVRELARRAGELQEKIERVKKAEDPFTAAIESKAIETERKAFEKLADNFAKKFGGDLVLVEDIARMKEQVAKEKMYPLTYSRPGMSGRVKKVAEAKPAGETKAVETEAKPEVKPTVEEPKVEQPKVEEPVKKGRVRKTKPAEAAVKVEEPTVEQKTEPIVEVKKKAKAVSEPQLLEKYGDYDIVKVGRSVEVRLGGEKVPDGRFKNIDEAKRFIDEMTEVEKTARDLDASIGLREAEPIDSGFMRPKEEALELKRIFAERKSAVESDPEIFMQKLVNDARLWFYGDESIDIAKVRSGLRKMVERSGELRDYFMTGVDHLYFTEVLSEASKWVDLLQRPGGAKIGKAKRKPKLSPNQLNVMVPVERLPEAVKDYFRGLREYVRSINFRDLYRNTDIWKKTGYWLGKDGKWRFEVHLAERDINVDGFMRLLSGQDIQLKEALSGEAFSKISKAFPEANEISIYRFLGGSNNGISLLDSKKIGINAAKVNDIQDFASTLLHELQHHINFSRAANYGANFGEILKEDVIRKISDVIRARPSPIVDTAPLTSVVSEFVSKVNRSGYREAIRSLYEADEPSGVLREFKAKHSAENIITEAYYKYLENPGEMEARVASARATMNPETLKLVPPWETLDTMARMEGLSPGATSKLYSGVDPTLAGRAIVEGAKKVKGYVEKAFEAKKFDPRVIAKTLRREWNRAIIDTSGNIRDQIISAYGEEWYRVLQRHNLTRGASSLAAENLKQMRKVVYDGLSGKEKKILDTLVLAQRMIDIGAYKTPGQFKFPGGLSVKDFVYYKELFGSIEKLTPEQAAKLSTRADAYFEWMKKPLLDMKEAGLITEQEFIDLASHNYRRISLVDAIDPSFTVKVGNRKMTVYDSGVQKLARGRETDIYEPSSEVMALEVFNRAYGRILNNKANLELKRFAENNPDNGFVMVKSKENKVPSGWQRVYYMEDGVRKSLWLEPEFAKEWVKSSPEISYKMANILRWASGSQVVRVFATGIDWAFAVANFIRDIQHLWIASRVIGSSGKWESVYSPHLPIYAAQIASDIIRVSRDALTRSGRFNEYMKEGGGMELLTHQGRLFQKGKYVDEGPIAKLVDMLGYVNETSEILTRLAIRDRVIRKRAKERGISFEEAKGISDITTEATFAARDYMDFSRGGYVSKTIDVVVPYLNASINGTRGLFRALKPGSGTALSSAYKMAQLATVFIGIKALREAMAPETDKELKNDLADVNNLVVPLGPDIYEIDSRGEKRYLYYKIPLDPSQKFFKVLTEAVWDKWNGKEVDVDRVTESLKSLMPVDISSLPPTVSAAIGYFTNKDFWRNKDIWERTIKPFSKHPEEEWTTNTPQVYKDIGRAVGASPERLKFAAEELLTTGSVWVNLGYMAYDAAFKDLPGEQKEQALALAMAKTPGIKRFIGATNPYSKHSKMIDEAEEKSMVEKFVQNRGMDALVEAHLYGSGVSYGDIVKYAASFNDKKVYDRLMDRFKYEVMIKGVSEKSFWRRMKGIDVDARARVFSEELKKASPEEKKRIWGDLLMVKAAGGVYSSDFINSVMQYMKE